LYDAANTNVLKMANQVLFKINMEEKLRTI